MKWDFVTGDVTNPLVQIPGLDERAHRNQLLIAS